MDRLFKTKNGGLLLSVVWGLGIAALFYNACKDGKCIVVKAPADTSGVYEFDDSCYKFKTYPVKCAKGGVENFCNNSDMGSDFVRTYDDAHFQGDRPPVKSCTQKNMYRSPACLALEHHVAENCGDPRHTRGSECYKYHPMDTIFRSPSEQIYDHNLDY